MIVIDFRTAIGVQFPSGGAHGISTSSENSIDAEIALHHAYGVNKARFFAGREKVFPLVLISA